MRNRYSKLFKQWLAHRKHSTNFSSYFYFGGVINVSYNGDDNIKVHLSLRHHLMLFQTHNFSDGQTRA